MDTRTRSRLRAERIPVGDVELHDNNLPGLTAGNWTVEVTHELQHGGTAVNTDPLRAVQEIVVSAPQFAIDRNAILAMSPPDASSGRYGDVLPHVVLGDPMLPWERRLGDDRKNPWLALLVLTDDELIGATASPTRLNQTTVGSFVQPDATVLKPALTVEGDVAQSDPCGYIQLSTEVFTAVTPRLAEIEFLAHCRGANTGDRPILGIDEDGLFAVVVANRFPAVAERGSATATKNIVHLVSLEGHEKLLVDKPDFAGHTSVALLSLASWAFWAHPDQKEDFRGLSTALARTSTGEARPAEDLWLCLTPPYPGAKDPVQQEVRRRVEDGFVPLAYRTRSAETTFAWYRGPLTPVVPEAVPELPQAPTADAVIGYQPEHGVFDLSLAAAFETGRGAALADHAFAQQLLDLFRRVRQIAGALHQRTHSPCFQGVPADSLSHDTTAQSLLTKALGQTLLSDLGATPPKLAERKQPPRPLPAPAPDLKASLTSLLEQPAVKQQILDATKEDTAPPARWLGRLLLLHPVPFTALVPDERMLPPESVRFGYLDQNWLDALLSGALSVGIHSSLDAHCAKLLRQTLRDSGQQAARTQRTLLRGLSAGADPRGAAPPVMSGLLLRSALVSGWPNLAVRGYGKDEKPVTVLRLDRLSPTVLLCLFEGVPQAVELAEPSEGFRFGVDDDGRIPLRNLIAPKPPETAPGLGAPFPDKYFQVRDRSAAKPVHLRTVSGRVLDLAGLCKQLGAELDAAHGSTVSPVHSADLATQLVKVPESVRFEGPTKPPAEKKPTP